MTILHTHEHLNTFLMFFRIFAQSSRGQSSSHPDSRAIIFGEKNQSKKIILEFISVLNGFKKIQELAEKFQGKYDSMGFSFNGSIIWTTLCFNDLILEA